MHYLTLTLIVSGAWRFISLDGFFRAISTRSMVSFQPL